MKQTKLESLLERLVDVSTGFIISVFIYKYVILTQDWLWENAFLVTLIFTVVSIVRGYLWRRFFNAEMHKLIKRFVRGLYENR